MATYATRDFLAQYKNVDKAIDPVILMRDEAKIRAEIEKWRDIYETYQGYSVLDGGIDKRELKSRPKLMMLLLDTMPDIYDEVNSSLYGGIRIKTNHRKTKKTSKRKRITFKRKPKK